MPRELRDSAFPFWRFTLSIAAGVLIAGAIIFAAAQMLQQYRLDQAAKELEAQAQQLQAELDEVARQEAAVTDEERRRQRVEAARRREQVEGPHMQAATADTEVGEPVRVHLHGTTVVRRESNGWQQVLRDGRAQRCRTER